MIQAVLTVDVMKIELVVNYICVCVFICICMCEEVRKFVGPPHPTYVNLEFTLAKEILQMPIHGFDLFSCIWEINTVLFLFVFEHIQL